MSEPGAAVTARALVNPGERIDVAEATPALVVKNCQDCEEQFETRWSGRAKRCPTCQRNARRRAARDYSRRARGTTSHRASAQLIRGRWCCHSCGQELNEERGAGVRGIVICLPCRESPPLQFLLTMATADSETGCLVWTRKLAAKGYPVYSARINGKTISHRVHRLVLAHRLGYPIDGLEAHHTCANTSCINPQHLTAVPRSENLAEMRLRKYYIARIAQLEGALGEVAPAHPLLG